MVPEEKLRPPPRYEPVVTMGPQPLVTGPPLKVNPPRGERIERIKRLRDALGNQMVSELLIRTIARKGYMLTIDKKAIRMN